MNSGAACLDACGECKDENGNPVMKQWWDMTDEDQKADRRYHLVRGGLLILPRRRIFFSLLTKSRDACDHDPSESGERTWTGDSDRRGLDRETSGGGVRQDLETYRLDLALHLVSHPDAPEREPSGAPMT